MDTEFLTGCLWGVSAILKPFSHVQFVIKPLFDEETMRGNVSIQLQLKLFKIIFEFLRSLLHKPMRSFVWFIVHSPNSGEAKNGIFKGFKRRNSDRPTP